MRMKILELEDHILDNQLLVPQEHCPSASQVLYDPHLIHWFLHHLLILVQTLLFLF